MWPQNGMRITGNSITIKGQVDDPTASVNVSSVDTTGNTNIYAGRTGRDGVFWIENVPVGASSNVFALTATSAAGQSSTNFTLTQSAISLIVNPMQAGDTTASGTIGASGYTIWVNGIKATNNGDGTWSATIAPITVGGGQVQVTAIPNTDNGGNGTGGSGNGGTGNPSSTQSVNTQTTVQAPQGAYQSGFHENWQLTGPEWDGYEYITTTWTDVMDWEDGQCGGHRHRTWDNQGIPESSDVTWPATSWPQSPGALPLVALTQNSYSGPSRSGSCTCVDTINSKLKLATGGPLGSKALRLWCVSAGGVTYDNEDAYPNSPSTTILSQEISIGGYGNLGTDGILWLVLPDNDPDDISPSASGVINGFSGGAGGYDLVILANGIALNPNSIAANANFCVGQNVSFSLSSLPSGVTATNFQWSLDGNFYNQMISPQNNKSSCTYTKNASLLKYATLPTNWWTSGGSPATYTANVTCTLVFTNGNPNRDFTASGKFTMYRPTATVQAKPPFTVCLGSIDGALAVQLGVPYGGNDTTNGMKFDVTITSTANGMGAVTPKDKRQSCKRRHK